MQKCLELAETALQGGNPPVGVGAILVYQGQMIGEGIGSGNSTGDITNHAEILVVRDAIQKGHSDKLTQARMYTTHEPCIMCSYVIRHHQIAEIIYGLSVDHIGGQASSFKILLTEEVSK